MVGAAEQIRRRLVARSACDTRGARLPAWRRGSQTVDDSARGLEVVLAQQHDELLAAVASERVARAQLRTPGGGRLLEEAVPGLVAMVVVVGLETVEVEDRDADRVRLAGRLLE